MNQKTKKTFIFIIIFAFLFLVAIFIFNEINKNSEQNINNNINSLEEVENQTPQEGKDELEKKELEKNNSEEDKKIKEKEEYLLNLINFNVIQLLIMEGYLESDLTLNNGLIINEKEALFKYQHKGKEMEIQINFDYSNNSELMINDYRILNETKNEPIEPIVNEGE